MMEVVAEEVKPKPEEQLLPKAQSLTTIAQGFQVTSKETSDDAAKIVTEQIDPLIKEAHDLLDPVCELTNKAHKAATGARAAVLEPLTLAKAILLQEVSRWANAERLAEEKRKREAVERLEREEAERLEEKIEHTERAALDAGATPEQALEEVRAVIEAPRPTPAPIYAAAPKVAGLSIPTVYTATVDRRREFIQGILDGKIPWTAIELKQPFIDRMANSMKESFNWPGCTLHSTSKARPTGRK
jgi:hypothetical protein